METQGDRLRQALAARGIRKQMAFAAELGVHESAITRWQSGAGISLKHAIQVCEVLDISLDWLVLGRGGMDTHRAAKCGPSRLSDATARLPAPIIDALADLAARIQSEMDALWEERPK